MHINKLFFLHVRDNFDRQQLNEYVKNPIQ